MKLRNKSQRKSLNIALFAATLASTTIIPMISYFTPAAQAGVEQAKSADAFVDLIGVNTHLGYTGSAYGRYDDLIKPKLQELGVRHIRDGGNPYDNDFWAKVADLGSVGIKANVTFYGDPINEVISTVKKVGGAIESIEGANESDLGDHFKYNGQGFPEGTRSYQNDLYSAIKGDSATSYLKVILPSMGWGENAGKLGYLESGDVGNMHSYPGLGNPSTDGLDWYYIPHARTIAGSDKPLWVTETGYYNLTTDAAGISEQAGGKYLPRLLLENFNRNIERVYLYEFIDQNPSGDGQQHFGLLRNDGSAKPAFTSIKNMIALLKEPGANFTPGKLDYTLGGNTSDVHSTLLQKKTGEYYLILWQEVTSWDTENKEDIGVGSRQITVNLNTTVTKAEVYQPEKSTSAVLTHNAPSGGRLQDITVAVTDQPVVIKLSPNGTSSSGGSGGSAPTTSQSAQVTVYQHGDFIGQSQSFGEGKYLAGNGQLNIVGNDAISSIRVPKGLKVRVCEHENAGLCRTFKSGDYAYIGDDLNDKISYIHVKRQE